MSDSWAYKEIAGGIASDIDRQKAVVRPPLTGDAALLAGAFDAALEMIGRSGREVLYGLMEQRYGLKPTDIPTKPGVYMSALGAILARSASVVEKYVLDLVKEKTGIEAHTLEEAVAKLMATGFGQSH